MKKIIIVLATIAVVASIFYISLPRVRNNTCVMDYDVSKSTTFACPEKGQVCKTNFDFFCPACCNLNTIFAVNNRAYILAITSFILYTAWRIFKNKLKREEIAVIAKTLLFLGIIAVILILLSTNPAVFPPVQ